MEDSVRVGKASDLADGDMMLAEVGEEHVLVCRLGGNYFAAGDGCPHAGGSLSDGYLEGEEVECPLHGSLFSIRTGGEYRPSGNGRRPNLPGHGVRGRLDGQPY